MAEVPPGLAAPLEAYCQHLARERRLSPHTVAAARRDLLLLARFAAREGLARPDAIDTHALRRWLAGLHRGGHQPVSLHRYLASVRGWFRWLVAEGQCQANPAAGLRAPRFKRALPQVIPADALAAALDQPAEGPVALRDRALVETFYSTGLRLAELHALNVVDVAGDEVRVLGKGGKERLVWLGGKARAALDAWLAVRAGWLKRPEAALFLNPRGGRLSRSGIALALKAWARRTGLDVPLHPHRLRHAFATHLLEETQDLRAVQEFLGHAQLSTTQIYTQVDFRRLAAVYDAAHPRARKRRDDPPP